MQTNQNSKNDINRKRNTIWFNPPFSKPESTKTGHYFLNLLDKHLPKIINFTVFSTGITSKLAIVAPKT